MDTNIRIKTEPVDDYYNDSYNNNNSLDQTPCSSSSSSGKLGKRTKPTWSLRELELSDDERGGHSSNSSEYEPSGTSEEEMSESEVDSDTANQTTGIKKRRLSNTTKKAFGRGNNKTLEKSYSANFFSRLPSSSSSSNSSISSSAPNQQNNNPSFLQFKLQNGHRRKQQFPPTSSFPQNLSIQSIAHSITINNNVLEGGQRKKPTPELTPIKSSSAPFLTTPMPELFLMEKIDQIKTLNKTITNDVDNYTKCLVIFDQIFRRLRSHPPSEIKKLVTLQLSSLLEIIKQRKDEGNSKAIQEKLLQTTNKIHSFLRVWPTPELLRVNQPTMNINNNNNNNTNAVIKQYKPRFATTTNMSSTQLPATTLNRFGTTIRQVPQLTPTKGLVTQRYMVVNPLNRTSTDVSLLKKTPVTILPKILPKIQGNQTASGQPPPLIAIDAGGGGGIENFSPLNIQSIKTLAPTSTTNLPTTSLTNSLNLNRSVTKPATQCQNQNSKLKQGNNALLLSLNNYVATDVDSEKAAEVVAAEQADRIPWMGIRDADLTEEGNDVEVLDEISIVAAEPIFIRGKYPPNVPIFFDKQLPELEEENGQRNQLVPPNETFPLGAEDAMKINDGDNLLAANTEETREFSDLLKQLANQSHHNAQQGFPITAMNSSQLWQGQVLSQVPRNKLGSKSSSTQPDDDEVILLSDSDDETEGNSAGGNILTTQSELNSSVQTATFVNEGEQMSDECVLGI